MSVNKQYIEDYNTFSINEGYSPVVNPDKVEKALKGVNPTLYNKVKIDLNQSSDGGGPGKGWVKLVAGYIFLIMEGNQNILDNCDVFYLETDIQLQSGMNTTNLGVKTKYKFFITKRAFCLTFA